MYNLIEYSDYYLKTSGSLWQYYRDYSNGNVTQSESFKYKTKITGKTPAARNTKDVKIAVPLKYLSDFWRTLEMQLINCEINLILTWSEASAISFATGETKIKIIDIQLYVPYNAKLLQQLKSGFKRRINWNNYQTKVPTE